MLKPYLCRIPKTMGNIRTGEQPHLDRDKDNGDIREHAIKRTNTVQVNLLKDRSIRETS